MTQLIAPPTKALRSQGNPRARLRSVLMAPARYSTTYLFGTFGVFLTSNLVGDVGNLPLLCLFVTLSYLALYLGFRAGALSSPTPYRAPVIKDYGRTRPELWLLLVGSAYFAVWGVNQIYEFGGGSLVEVIQTIISPGEAYKAKFEIYQMRIDTNRVSRVTQLLVLLSLLYAINVPLGVVSWSRQIFWTRAIFVASVLIYVASFLFIGTMKGIGDVFLFAIAGLGVMLAKQALKSKVVISRTQARGLIAVLAVTLFAYMASNQVARADEFGITESRVVGDVSKTFIAQTFGQNVAFGVYSALSYPSHGYLGLSYSLQQPFEFSHGAGISQAWESYRLQFLGGENNLYLTYPYRTEPVTGWPAGMYWSTIFPWLASDMTFFLVPIFMAVVGFVFGRVWVACIFGRSVLALATLGHLVIFVAFIPANNQVLMQRQGLWVVISILTFWVLKKLQPRLGQARA